MYSFKCPVIYIIYISYMCDHVCMFSFLRLKENMFVNFKKFTSIWTGSSKSWSVLPPPPHLAGSIHLKSKPPSPAGSQTFFSGKDEHQHESFTVYLGSLVPACSCCSIAKLCSDVLRLYRSHLKSFQDVKPFPQYSSSNADELCILFHPFFILSFEVFAPWQMERKWMWLLWVEVSRVWQPQQLGGITEAFSNLGSTSRPHAGCPQVHSRYTTEEHNSPVLSTMYGDCVHIITCFFNALDGKWKAAAP